MKLKIFSISLIIFIAIFSFIFIKKNVLQDIDSDVKTNFTNFEQAGFIDHNWYYKSEMNKLNKKNSTKNVKQNFKKSENLPYEKDEFVVESFYDITEDINKNEVNNYNTTQKTTSEQVEYNSDSSMEEDAIMIKTNVLENKNQTIIEDINENEAYSYNTTQKTTSEQVEYNSDSFIEEDAIMIKTNILESENRTIIEAYENKDEVLKQNIDEQSKIELNTKEQNDNLHLNYMKKQDIENFDNIQKVEKTKSKNNVRSNKTLVNLNICYHLYKDKCRIDSCGNVYYYDGCNYYLLNYPEYYQYYYPRYYN